MDDAEPKVYRPQMFVNEPWYSLEPLPATSWLIKDFLPEGTLDYPYLMVIGGDPGSYKTTVLAAMLGSDLWTLGSQALWQHGPAAMALNNVTARRSVGSVA